MNAENMKVLTNIIGAVESGGQVYGKRDYAAYSPPYYNTPAEHTITLGWAQNYGSEAEKLIQMIYDADPAEFKRIDANGSIQGMLGKDWEAMRWNPTAAQENTLIRLIDSPAGHKAQDALFADLMGKYINSCEALYTKDVPAEMMYCEIRHLGGRAAADRIFRRCQDDYSLDNILRALDMDDPDSNQVGARKFRSRHLKCIEFIRKYAERESSMTTIVDEFEKYIGTVEYNGIVATIQKWYYGTLVKDAWCATSTSYFAHVAGILDQLGGKNEGVFEMMNACRSLHQTDGRFWDYPNIPKDLQRHDVIFFKRSGMSHVAHCWNNQTYTGTGMINVLGGNQGDMICKKNYKQIGIQAVYRPKYGGEPSGGKYMFAVSEIKQGDKNNSVLLFQEITRARGYKDQYGELLKLDKDFGTRTKWVAEWYVIQRNKAGANLGEPNGIVTSKVWRDLLAL